MTENGRGYSSTDEVDRRARVVKEGVMARHILPCGAHTDLCRASGKPVAYGAVRFPGSMRTPAKWACAASDQDQRGLGSMVRLLSDTWKLHKPSVIVSVTGMADGVLPMNEKQQRVVRRGLMRAVGRTKAWILTDGLNGGAARLVGRAVHESGDTHTHVIGISDWHNVRYRKQLEAKGGGKVCRYGEVRVRDGPADDDDLSHAETVWAKFPLGSRAQHPDRGVGTVTEHMDDGRTRIAFDTSEEHRYKPSAMDKLVLIAVSPLAAAPMSASASGKPVESGTTLEPHHSHFLLLDTPGRRNTPAEERQDAAHTLHASLVSALCSTNAELAEMQPAWLEVSSTKREKSRVEQAPSRVAPRLSSAPTLAVARGSHHHRAVSRRRPVRWPEGSAANTQKVRRRPRSLSRVAPPRFAPRSQDLGVRVAPGVVLLPIAPSPQAG